MGIPVEGTQRRGRGRTRRAEHQIRRGLGLCAIIIQFQSTPSKKSAWQQGHAATFLPKWDKDRVGSSSHVHQSLWKDGKPAFFDQSSPWKVRTDGSLHGGADQICRRLHIFHGPLRQQLQAVCKGSFAPTRSFGPSTTAPQATVCAAKAAKAIRVECRIPGSDMNPYLAQAAMLAAGIKGIEEKLALPPAFAGDAL